MSTCTQMHPFLRMPKTAKITRECRPGGASDAPFFRVGGRNVKQGRPIALPLYRTAVRSVSAPTGAVFDENTGRRPVARQPTPITETRTAAAMDRGGGV